MKVLVKCHSNALQNKQYLAIPSKSTEVTVEKLDKVWNEISFYDPEDPRSTIVMSKLRWLFTSLEAKPAKWLTRLLLNDFTGIRLPEKFNIVGYHRHLPKCFNLILYPEVEFKRGPGYLHLRQTEPAQLVRRYTIGGVSAVESAQTSSLSVRNGGCLLRSNSDASTQVPTRKRASVEDSVEREAENINAAVHISPISTPQNLGPLSLTGNVSISGLLPTPATSARKRPRLLGDNSITIASKIQKDTIEPATEFPATPPPTAPKLDLPSPISGTINAFATNRSQLKSISLKASSTMTVLTSRSADAQNTHFATRPLQVISGNSQNSACSNSSSISQPSDQKSPTRSSPQSKSVSSSTSLVSKRGTGKCRMTTQDCPLANCIFLLSPCLAKRTRVQDLFGRHGCKFVTSIQAFSHPGFPRRCAQTNLRTRKMILVDVNRIHPTVEFLKQVEAINKRHEKEIVEVYDWRILEYITKVHKGNVPAYDFWKRCSMPDVEI